jgi:hypothetical protein
LSAIRNAAATREVNYFLNDFLRWTGADERITVHQAPTVNGRLRSVALPAEAVQLMTA